MLAYLSDGANQACATADMVSAVLSASGFQMEHCRSLAEVGRRADNLNALCAIVPIDCLGATPLLPMVESMASLAPGMRRILVGPAQMQQDHQVAEGLLRGLLYDVIALPGEEATLVEALKRIERLTRIEAAIGAKAIESAQTDNQMVGTSAAIRVVFDSIRKLGPTDVPVLITGESGTGKELAAKAIHDRSRVAQGPFIAINCAGIPSTLIESELFGYEKGAFTGAQQRKTGRVETAHGGTLFLDEIGDMSLEVQAHLLRFVQEGKIQRLGGTKEIPVKARIIVATNVNLEKAVAEGRFREDLYYRLKFLTLEMPPLRDREDDIEILANFFLTKFSREAGRLSLRLGRATRLAMRRYGWPGNVRELIGAMRRASVMSTGQVVRPEDLGISSLEVAACDKLPTLTEARTRVEEELVRRTLNHHDNNVVQAAKSLGISRVLMYRLMRKHGVAPKGSADEIAADFEQR